MYIVPRYCIAPFIIFTSSFSDGLIWRAATGALFHSTQLGRTSVSIFGDAQLRVSGLFFFWLTGI